MRLGWESILQAAHDIPAHRELFKFLVSFFFYMSGLGAVVAFAAIYAEKVLGFSTMENIVLFASLQLSSAIGAFACGSLQDKVGSRATLSVALLLWCAVAIGAYFSTGKLAFFVVGNVAGLAIGSSQAASRAVVTLLSPRERAAEFFGFWGVFGKTSAIVGPLTMGVLADAVGLRESILVTLVFFLAGLAVLRTVRIPCRAA